MNWHKLAQASLQKILRDRNVTRQDQGLLIDAQKKLASTSPVGVAVIFQSTHKYCDWFTLLLLHEKGALGVVAYDFRGGPPFRLPAYTWALMRKHGLVIETRREQHECGWHGRFVLHTPIEILAIANPAKLQAERQAA